MSRVAVFIDAGYFWVQACQSVLGRMGQRHEIAIDFPALRTELLNEVSNRTSAEVLRVYWYDGPGPSGKGQDHQRIEELDDFKLRLGTINSRGQQKAVDGLIIADMLSLTQTKAIDHAVLLSGDADLTPGVTAAQAMGLRVLLFIFEPRIATSPYLAAEADSKLYLDAAWIRRFTKVAQSNINQQQSSTLAARQGQSAASSSFDMNASALATHTAITSGSLAHLLIGLTRLSTMLPPQVDKQLLYDGRSRADRALTEQEKRDLRAAFKLLL